MFAVVVPQLDCLRDALRNKGLEEIEPLNASSLCASTEAIDLVNYTFMCIHMSYDLQIFLLVINSCYTASI